MTMELFGPGEQFETGDDPLSIVVCDFNDDGALDISTANTHSDDVSVLFWEWRWDFPGPKTV